MEPTYQQQTVNARNPIARFAHRNRVARTVHISSKLLPPNGRLLDYGCGEGTYIRAMQDSGYHSLGYEPYMLANANADIFRDFSDIQVQHLQFDLITILETIEHLNDDEFHQLLSRAKSVLAPGGKLLFSAPIEVGPAVLLKEFNRAWRQGVNQQKVLTWSLIKAGILAIPETRATNIKISHKGFDFRRSIASLTQLGCPVTILSYGPLPLPTWYGNSQVYFWVDPSHCQL